MKDLKDRLIKDETTLSHEGLTQKLEDLTTRYIQSRETVGSRAEKERVTCIATSISESERRLLERGPKFVPTRQKLTVEDLRAVESKIEKTINSLRFLRENGQENVGSSNEERVGYNLLREPKIRMLIKPKEHAKQPLKMDIESERRVIEVKSKIMQAYRRYRPSRSNITKTERSTMRGFRKRNEIVKCSDKSKSLVVMDRDAYLEKAEAILSDTHSYERTQVSSEALEQLVSGALKKIKTLGNLPPDIYKGLFPQESRLPEFYGLPKIHKQGAPLRPVVAAFDGPLTPISKFLERILHQLLRFVPAHIENSLAATQSLRKSLPSLRATENVIIVAMDVVALYPSIPIDDGIFAVVEKLKEHENDVDTAGVSITDIQSLLQLVLRNNYFKFGDETYRQKKGVAMGNHLAPPLAIIFMDRLEQNMLRTAEFKPASYDRYVDDCLMVWNHGETELTRFLKHCNQQHPNIQFTWESSLYGNSVSFMDLQISVREDGQVEYELYQKPSDSGITLSYTSCVPQHLKISVATQQFRRARTLSSNPAANARSLEKIGSVLRGNDYQDQAIQVALERSQEARKKGKEETKPTVALRLPFCSDSLDKVVRRIVRKSGLTIRIAYNQAATLKDRLVRSALLPKTCPTRDRFLEQENREKKKPGKPRDDCLSCQAGIRASDCDKRGVIYSLRCNFCGEEYIGESQRPLRTRLKEHQLQARNRTKYTPWGEHMDKHRNEQVEKKPVFAAKILAIEGDSNTRKAREAIEIRDKKPSINKSKGWSLA